MAARKSWVSLLLIDVALVVLFAGLGRRSHERGLSVLGIMETAAPFLVALLVFAAVTRFPTTSNRVWPHGVVLWVGTVALGLILRVLTGATAALPFVIVAAVTLGILLLGRRAVASLVAARKVRSGRAVN
jgi:hypothetical protein